MKLSELSPEDFAAYMRRKREKSETESFEMPDVYDREFVNGVKLRIRKERNAYLASILAESEINRWGIFIRIPRTHALYGRQMGVELFQDLELPTGGIDYQYEPEANRYLISISYSGTAEGARNVGHTIARRVAHVTAKPISDGIMTKAVKNGRGGF